jgi:SAM-dependent methyltransferase
MTFRRKEKAQKESSMQVPPRSNQLNSAYVVQDQQSEEELTRLTIQNQMLTTSMGGVLPEQTDPTYFERVLDVGCASGGWVIETAQKYPSIKLVGVDSSKRMIDYARAQAVTHGVAKRVEFRVMDALRMLEFPNNSFDLVNLRLGNSFLRTWDWPKLLAEFQRVTRRGGTVRITECDIVESTSPALTYLYQQVFLQAVFNAGFFFKKENDGLTSELVPLLTQQGVRDVQTRLHTLEYHGGTPEGLLFAEDMKRGYRTFRPFFQKWVRLPEDYEAIYQQALNEMQQQDFKAIWRYLTAWGTTYPTPEKSDL